MSFEWRSCSLAQIALNGKEGFVDGPFGSALPASLYQPSGIPVIRGSNLSKGQERFRGDEFVYVSRDTSSRLARASCIADDLIFTKKGTLGQVGIIPRGQYPLYLLSSNQMRLRVDLDVAHPEFVYYYLAQEESISKIIRDSEHTGVPKINLAYLRDFPIVLPSIKAQTEIVLVLRTLDDRITLLRETNATLEAIAQALFKSWFVDFDPVRAKAAGFEPQAMDATTAALFPDSFEESELGLVPKGWQCSTVEKSFILTMGQSPPGDTYNEVGEGLAFYQGRTDFGFRFPKQRIFCTEPTRLAKAGDTLVSVRAPVGDVNVALEACALGRGVAGLRHPDGHQSFVFYAVRCLKPHFEMYDGEGTVFGSINKKDFQALPIVVPTSDVLMAFETLAAPLDAAVENNEQKLRYLTQLRDTLLPRLISGQLRLPEAEALLEGAL